MTCSEATRGQEIQTDLPSRKSWPSWKAEPKQLVSPRGMAAINGLFEATLRREARFYIPTTATMARVRIEERISEESGIVAIEVDMDDVRNIEAAITPRTKLIWIETPSNPQLKVADIRAIAALGRKNILTACDSMNLPPCFSGRWNLASTSSPFLHEIFSGNSDVLG